MSMPNRVWDFMAWRKIAAIISITLVVLSIGSLSTRGLNLGLDFTGGTLIELEFADAPDIESVRTELSVLGVTDAIVVFFGADTDVLVRTSNLMVSNCISDAEVAAQAEAEGRICADILVNSLNTALNANAEVLRVEAVGPQIGEELREDGGLGLLAALLVVMLYVALRFQYKFSIGAVVALFHDVLITLGIFSIFFWEFDLTVLAALLAVIGYSLNDTIVVFDRIRENFRAMRQVETIEAINISLTQTLGRTMVTSLTTLLVLVVLYLFGGEMINKFALALIIGIVIGTYSSIYVATNVVIALNVRTVDLLPPERDDSENEFEETPYS
jgi:preprotein translocase subunit SecF